MFRRVMGSTRRALELGCLVLLLVPAAARGEGSMSFDGSSSKLQNDSANVLAGSNDITICAWIYAATTGEGGSGFLIALDPAGSGMWSRISSGPVLTFNANYGTTEGSWSFPLSLGVWTPVAMSYSKSNINNVPTFRVNFANVSPTPMDTPSGSFPAYNTGYCIGNESTQIGTWNGRIMHVQAFNRLLSAAEMDACALTPGSVRKDLRLWLPMTNASDVFDRSGNGFDGTATAIGTGADAPPITRELTLPPGVAVVPAGKTTITQHVLPRHADGTNYPSGELRGYGPASIVRGNSSTGSLPMGRRAVVVTEDYEYPNNIDYWQSGAFASITGVVSSATANNSPITITTSINHGRTTGESVVINVPGFAAANGLFAITVTSVTTFTLNNTSGSTGTSSGTGSWSFFGLPLTGSISSVSNSPMPPATVTTNAPHGFLNPTHDGHFMTISGVTGAGSNINSTHPIDVINSTTFTVPISTSGAGTGGKWTYDQRRAVLRPALRELTIAGHADSGAPPYNEAAGDNYTGLGIINSEPGIWHKVAGRIASISGTGTITVNSPGHSLVTGKTVMITGLAGYTLTSGAGPYTVTAPDANTFTFTGTGTGTHTANTGIWTSTDSWPDREHGALVRGSGARVENVKFFYIPGTCLTVNTGFSANNRKGRVLPFDSEKVRVWNCQFQRAYRGAEIAIVDAVVGGLNGFDLRDYGIKFIYGGAQIDGALHFYGVGVGGIDEPAVWFAQSAGGCWGGPIYAENSPVGMRGELREQAYRVL